MPWGANCKLTFQPDGEIWMVKDDGRDASKACCWKTQNGDGPKLMNSDYKTKISIWWDNSSSVPAYLRDEKTIIVVIGGKDYKFGLNSHKNYMELV